ncbi:GLPGLI family protein [Lacinutrix jangbogonensis]|uniref:GLPGLI family protein n=1 Tax=Lacinutrix jangbogonensis TaxID=1469557 RepID=UPI00053DF70D|nr:GLPGLI family protein [Lacinutrix jangbogonensis]
MKLIVLLLSISISIVELSAQETLNYNLKIKYDINYNTELPNTKKGTLYVDNSNSKSIFIYGKKTTNSQEQSDEDDLTFKLISSGVVKFNYLDLLKDTLYSKEKASNKVFVIEEKKPLLNWTLKNEEKIIDGIKVKKALVNFRGRNYVAWYNELYPIKFGPWKFSGLPGLIFEIYDESMRYHWIVTSISKQEEKSLIIDSLYNNLEKIDIKKYVDYRYNSRLSIINESRLPRGTVIKKNKIKRNGMEIEFEWEKETKE